MSETKINRKACWKKSRFRLFYGTTSIDPERLNMAQKSPLQIAGLSLDRASPVALYHQLYERFRDLILRGRLQAGQNLPSSRALTAELGVSRNTVSLAYDRLFSEGYIVSKTGSGTYVNDRLPEDLLNAGTTAGSRRTKPAKRRARFSELGARALKTTWSTGSVIRPFQHGIPAVREFPVRLWSRLSARFWRTASGDELGYGHPAGYPPLRQAVAAYLRTSRAVACSADQVIIVSGSQQGLDVAARVLLNPGDQVWIEDPGYNGAWGALTAAGARLVPVPLDREGLKTTVGRSKAPAAKMAYVTPSHQYPIGATMSLARRLDLLEWARTSGAWILEDDYDSEYRYGERPLASLQGLDRDGRVIYIGSFSKVLIPALRLGYVVVPAELTDVFTAALALIHRHPSTVDQAVLAAFMSEGHFGRHIRRMRVLYEERQKALVDAVTEHLEGVMETDASNAGMHLVGWIKKGTAGAFSKRAEEAGVGVTPLSAYAISQKRLNGVVMGYAAFSPNEIREAVVRLRNALV